MQSESAVESESYYGDILSSHPYWPGDLNPPPQKFWLESDREAANRAATAQLEMVVSLRRDNLTLDEAISFVRGTTGVNVAVNWPALELAGIEQDALASCRLKRVPARVLLQFILDQVSADTYIDNDRAGFIVKDGIVLISTLRDLKPAAETLVYDVRGLFLKPKLQASLYRNQQRAAEIIELLEQDDWWSQYDKPAFDLNDALSGTNSGGSMIDSHKIGLLRPEGQLKQKQQAEDQPLSNEDKIDILAEIIQTSVGDPDEWLDEESTLSELNGNLIVKTTPENHRALSDVLVLLEKSQAKHFEARAITIEVYLLLEQAEAYRLVQDDDQALKKIKQALRVDPNNAEAIALENIIEASLAR
ncbi:MAG: hypothetical protein AAGI37_06675 [Planctomycetota bacterium]